MMQLRVLGGLELRDSDGRALDGPSRQPKRLAVLAYLACARPRGYHRRDKLAALFWPELPEDRARAALRTTLSRLRDDLAAEVIVTRGGDEVGIEPGLLACDLHALEQAMVATDAGEGLERFLGEFLDSVHIDGAAEEFEHWVSGERVRIAQEMVAALVRAVERARVTGDLGRAVRAATRASELAPHDEAVARLVIELHVAAGDHGSARQAFERLRERLRRDLEVAPSAATAELVAALPAPPPRPVPAERAKGLRAGNGPRSGAPSAEEEAAAASASAARETRWPPAARWAVSLLTVALGATLLVPPARRWVTAEVPPLQWSAIRSNEGTPLHLVGPSVAFDSTGDALLIAFGNETMHPQRLNPRVMRLRGVAGDVAVWTTVPVTDTAAAPQPRWFGATAHDVTTDQLALFGGALGLTSPCLADTWLLRADSLGQRRWARVSIRGDGPTPRVDARLAFDASRKRLVMHGGSDCFTVHHLDTWILGFDDSSFGSGTWHQVRVDSTAGAPGATLGRSVVIDAAANRLFLLAGRGGATGREVVWLLEGIGDSTARWRRLGCANPPPALSQRALTYDAASSALVAFGGYDATDQFSNEVWRLDGLAGSSAACAWTLIPTGTYAPAPRAAGFAGVSRHSGDLVIFGGTNGSTHFSDAWRLRGVLPPRAR